MTDLKISDAACDLEHKLFNLYGASGLAQTRSEHLRKIQTAIDATRAEARREALTEAANLIQSHHVKWLTFVEATAAIRALATQPAPEPSEPMRSAEEWSALADESPMIVLDGERFLSFIRAIQTNAASAAEPLLEEAQEVIETFIELGRCKASRDVADRFLAKWVKT